jgi:hypothetical protein
MFSRLIAIVIFFIWRVKNNIADIECLSWLLNMLPRLNPIKSIPNLAALKLQHNRRRISSKSKFYRHRKPFYLG